MSKNTVLLFVAIIAVIIVGGLIYANSNNSFSFSSIFNSGNDKLGKAAVDYINLNKLSGSTPASFVSSSEASGVVKVKIKIGATEYDSYVSKDGKLLFPEGLDMAAKKNDSTANQTPAPSATVAKTDSPMLEAYVVARCPYGLQMQRAMAEAVKNIPTLAQYIKVRYMGSVSGNKLVSMHGDAEATENLRQICIRDEQPAKYWGYVACQMKTGDTAGCQTSTGVDSAKLNACVSDQKKGVTYAQKDFDLDSKYNVTGSPTLVLNGTTISESGYGGRSADGVKSMVCAGFKTASSFCSTALDKAAAAVSFSTTYAGAAGSASANSGANGTNCAPAQ